MIDTFASFNARTATLEQRGELTLLRVDNAHAHALIALQGAQVLEFQAHQQRPLLWLSESAEFRRGQSVRGGVPVCWPWFGALDRNPVDVQAMTRGEDLPAHGFVRNATWTLEAVTEHAERTTVMLKYATVATIQPEWPHNATLRLAIGVGKTLSLELSTRNEQHEPLAITQALHTYLPVSDIRAVEIRGLDTARYIDTLDDWQPHSQHGAVAFSGETDRIYLDTPARIELFDRNWQRTLVLHTRNSNSAVVWNPWIDKAKRLSQFGDEDWQRMLCIETANVLDDRVLLKPGAEHVLEVEIGEAHPI